MLIARQLLSSVYGYAEYYGAWNHIPLGTVYSRGRFFKKFKFWNSNKQIAKARPQEKIRIFSYL